jgi:LEA14-like dessication related protein
MKSIFKLSAIFSLVIILQSCIAFKDLEYKGIDSYKVEEISMSGLKLSLSVKIENPNWFNIKAKGGEIDVKLGGNSLGKFSLIDEVILPKKSDGIVTVRIESKFKSLLGGGMIGIMSMLRSGGETEIELNGYIKARALGVVKKIPISSKEKIKL